MKTTIGLIGSDSSLSRGFELHTKHKNIKVMRFSRSKSNLDFSRSGAAEIFPYTSIRKLHECDIVINFVAKHSFAGKKLNIDLIFVLIAMWVIYFIRPNYFMIYLFYLNIFLIFF